MLNASRKEIYFMRKALSYENSSFERRKIKGLD
jgi:hypothetical protein